MAEIMLQIAGRPYQLRCRDGEEAHMAHLAQIIEDKAYQAQRSTPGLTEVRTLLFAALFMADELNELKRAAGRQEQLALDGDDEPTARAVEALAARVEKLSEALAARAADA
ncbi:cell division protein ZapA [Sphingobium yanoikuyae]|uniref:Cell division protein ZapA n=1 Tax=Sphingobium yanoikuyae TaxID=13690 RepID=A0AA42WU36_SPHYA|nr:cell division protein ZapA [Sphingobium yanoikuyae]MDH2131768.1 cell division protein ZapA [Sphingobium yanoikuyae]MDH2151940.1 cell division protein ZapA [Sphingobium yanoikuyae]MDH2166925.1 cell division protein ZapA [Sphingobium yanoikuyae]